MAIRFDDIGNRLKAFRLGSGLSADEIASRLGISRTALYRFEKGELAKIETLEKLADLLSVSVPTLLGVGVEYVPSAVSYFERMRRSRKPPSTSSCWPARSRTCSRPTPSTRRSARSCARAFPTAPGRKRALAQVDELITRGAAPAQGHRRASPASST